MTPLASALDPAGTAQPGRLLAALREGAAPVDERSLEDLLGWARRYARLLRFRTADDADGGDWSAFLEDDPTVLVAAVAQADLDGGRAAFEAARAAFEAATTEADQQAEAAALVGAAADLAATLGGWRRRATTGLGLRAELDRLAATSLGQAARDLHALALRAAAVGLADAPASLTDTVAGLGAAPAEADPAAFPTGTFASGDDRLAFAEGVGQSFDALHAGAGYLAARAPALLDETLTRYPEHAPHVALFLAFLLLFRHAQDHVNAFGERHLRWTYEDVLGLAPHEAEPESVRVVFERARAAERHLLPAGTLLRGDKDPDGVERLYATDDDLVVTKARVERLLAVRVEAGETPRAPRVPARLVVVDPKAPEVDGVEVVPGLVLTDQKVVPDDLPVIRLQTGGVTWPSATKADLDVIAALTAAHGPPFLYAIGQYDEDDHPGTSSMERWFRHGYVSLSPNCGLVWKVDPREFRDFVAAGLPETPLFIADLGDGTVHWNAIEDAAAIAERLTPAAPPPSPRVWAAPVADSADGEGAEITRDDRSWAPFGDGATPAGRVGFAVASDVLRLGEGDRRVRLSLALDRLTAATLADLDAARAELRANLRVQLTGPDGWIEAPLDAVVFSPTVKGGTVVGSGGPRAPGGPILTPTIEATSSSATTFSAGTATGASGLRQSLAAAPNVLASTASALSLKGPDVAPVVTLELVLGADAPPVVPYSEAVHGLGLGLELRSPVLRVECVDGYAARGRTASGEGLSLPHVPTPASEAPYVEGTPVPAGALVSHEGRVWVARTAQAWLSTPGTNAAAWAEAARAHPLRHLGATDGRALGQPVLRGVTVGVDVEGLRTLVAEGDGAVLDPAKTVAPFGMQAREDARFVVASPELQKPLTALRLRLDWEGLPDEPFQSYYAEYVGDGIPTAPATDDFEADAELLVDGTWQPLAAADGTTTVALFEGGSGTPQKARAMDFVPGGAGPEAPTPFDRLGPDVRWGAVRLTLTQGFLHRLYPKRTAEIAIAAATPPPASMTTVAASTAMITSGSPPPPPLATATGSAPTLPNPPVTPLAAGLAVDYAAEAGADYTALDARDAAALPLVFFHLGPFGAAPVAPARGPEREAGGVLVRPTLLPRFTLRPDGATAPVALAAALYVGVADADPPETLSLLVQGAEGTADPDATAPAVVWEVLEGDTWRALRPDEVLADTTGGLLRSGIVRLALPRAADADHRLLPAGLRWVRASIAAPASPDALNRLVAVEAQAVRATRVAGRGPGEDALPAGTVAKLKSRPPAVKGVRQPFLSFGGRDAEGRDAFVRRVSERLRHRARAVTPSDYERIALEAFPVLHRVRCVPHARVLSDGTVREGAPGHVVVVVVPDLARLSVLDPLRPRVSQGLRAEVLDVLAEAAPDAVALDVRNAAYEPVRVEAKVRFRAGVDVGYALGAVDRALVDALSPWRDDGTIRFGGRVHRSWVLRFLEEHPSVDAVRDLVLVDAAGRRVETAEASSPVAVLTSAAAHVLTEWTPLPCPTPSF